MSNVRVRVRVRVRVVVAWLRVIQTHMEQSETIHDVEC